MSILAGCGLGFGGNGGGHGRTDGGVGGVGDGGTGGGGDGGSGGGGDTPPPPPKFTIGGTVTGLQGSLVLRNNGGDDLTVSADGSFTLATSIETGGPYLVTIQTQPGAQECVLANGSGTVAGANVVNVTVTCGAVQTTQLQAGPNVHSANLSWNGPHDATFNVHVSSAPGCDIHTACPDGAVLENVTSPLTVEELRNGQPYFFQVDATLSDGTHQLSNEASTRPNVLAFNSAIEAIAFGEEGTQYIGGRFSAVGIASGNAVPFDAASGQPAMPDFPIVMGAVLATVSDGVGGWYIGGSFTQVGDQPLQNLAHILADGTVDPHYSPDFNDQIEALAFSGDTLYVGGDFTSVNGLPRNRLAALDADGTVLMNWVTGANGAVFTLAVAGDVVYAGGQFTNIGPLGDNPVPRNRLAAIGVDSILRAWAPNVGNGSVSALEVAGDTVYVGGQFQTVDNMTRHNLAAISAVSATSAAAEVLPWDPDADEFVTALAIAGNTVYAGGLFVSVAGKVRNHLAAIDATGAGKQLLDWHPDVHGEFDFASVSALKVAGGTIYAGGSFDSIDAVKRSNLAAISIDGQVLTWSPAPNESVKALAIADNTVFAGGQFTGIASTTRHSLAAIDRQGRLTVWNPDAGVNVSVQALAVDVAGNTVYAGGSFAQVAGKARKNLAAIGTDGVLLDWSPETNNTVSALAVSDNTVYAGGSFTQITTTGQGMQARGRLAAIGTNGTLLDWNPSASDTVNTLLVSGGTVYIGGTFTAITTDESALQTRNRLAAIGTEGKGKLSDTWNPNANGPVDALAIIGDTLYAGGGFGQFGKVVGGQARSNLAAIGIDGELADWRADTDREVLTLAVSGNTLYAGGVFASVTGTDGLSLRHGLAAIDVGGNVLDWNPDADSSVSALAVFGNTVYAGGSFNTLGGLLRFSFGAIDAGSGEVIP
jgi:hypothetical protein